MTGPSLLGVGHQSISSLTTKDNQRNDLAMIFDGIALMCKQNQLPIPTILGVRGKCGTDSIDNHMKILMIADLCQSLSFLVRRESQMESQNQSTSTHNCKKSATEDKDYYGDGSRARMIIELSKIIMQFLDTENTSNLPPEEIDRMVLECLLDTYRIPSIVNEFETETLDFYAWWRRRIKSWIGDPYSKNPSCSCYQRLGWRHLEAMIRETCDQLRPPPLSIVVSGAGSKDVNGEYKLVSEYSTQQQIVDSNTRKNNKSHDIASMVHKRLRMKEPLKMDEPSACACVASINPRPPQPSQGGTGHSLWFATELDEELPNTDCDIDYYCALPRSGKRRRTNPIPPLQEWKRCSHGLFPSPKLTLSGEGACGSDTHWQRLARWILEEDLLSACLCSSAHMRSDEDVDIGVSSIMEFLIEIYEEQGRSNLGETTGSSLGTELLVKLAASCLEEQKRDKY
eukprot:CAMPEP_0116119164 /NCGR_PEP_ID=MMETSP0329-20121206/2492_1 /TAXON_ID=697910 /ORGANISM="Pseudo-nitzschia arenysensis, Strain B593" /LENGTH=454 /DNA_ID=CAMNT_0003612841 /DNA_START=68 /DNA_END=1433 /DNA_ORIENTATION=+